MGYLLDTTTVSDLVRFPQGRVAAHLVGIQGEEIVTSIIVAAELRYGAARKKSQRLTTQLERVLSGINILPFEAPGDQFYADLRVQLETIGRTIGANDLLIAAHALSLGYTLVTDNMREFSRVKDLAVENWMR